MRPHFSLTDLWLPMFGAAVLGALAAELFNVLGTDPSPTPVVTTALGQWPDRPSEGHQAVGAGRLPAGFLTAATGMMAALEAWRGVPFTTDVQVSVIAHDPLGRWGFYDPETDHLRVVADLPEMVGAMTVLHELTHALQDQHVTLPVRAPYPEGSDTARAWQAVIEGEAMLASAELTDVPLDGHGDLPSRHYLDDDAAESLFSYMDGARFVQILRDQAGWDAVEKALQDPTLTTAAILNPEWYLSSEAPIPPAELGGGHRVGAYALWRLLSRTADGRAMGRQLAAAWRGDAKRVDDSGNAEWVIQTTPALGANLGDLALAGLVSSGHSEPSVQHESSGRVVMRWTEP